MDSKSERRVSTRVRVWSEGENQGWRRAQRKRARAVSGSEEEERLDRARERTARSGTKWRRSRWESHMPRYLIHLQNAC